MSTTCKPTFVNHLNRLDGASEAGYNPFPPPRPEVAYVTRPQAQSRQHCGPLQRRSAPGMGRPVADPKGCLLAGACGPDVVSRPRTRVDAARRLQAAHRATRLALLLDHRV